MSLTEISNTLFIAVFKVLQGNVKGMGRNTFLKLRLSELLEESSTTGWPTFWAEVLTVTIRQEFRRIGVGISNFDESWFDDRNKAMQDLRNFIDDNWFPI